MHQLPRTNTNTLLSILCILFLTLSTFCVYTQTFITENTKIHHTNRYDGT